MKKMTLKKFFGGICCAAMMVFAVSCAQGFDDEETFSGGVTNTQVESPTLSADSFSTVVNADGSESVKVQWPVVFGAGGGVLFIPSHLVIEVVEGAAKTHVKDDFGFEMICQGRFTTAQIDKNTWSEEMLDRISIFLNLPRLVL